MTRLMMRKMFKVLVMRRERFWRRNPSSSKALDLDGMAERSVAVDFSIVDGGRVASVERRHTWYPYIYMVSAGECLD
jgi:hypothetical protein